MLAYFVENKVVKSFKPKHKLWKCMEMCLKIGIQTKY